MHSKDNGLADKTGWNQDGHKLAFEMLIHFFSFFIIDYSSYSP